MGRLVRAARLLRLAADTHVLLLTLHHIVSDAWTRRVLLRDLGALYEAFRAGRPSPLGGLSVQYADYAVWQRSWLRGEVLERQLDYWKRQLAGAPAALDLPADRPRPPVFTGHGARRRFALSAEVRSGIEEVARREDATLFMLLLAAFDVLLYRYTGEGDLVVGTPIAGRGRAEVEPLIGFFVNTLAIRVRCNGEASFVELLGQVREQCLGAYAHQDVPFERLVRDLAPERDLSRTPLFQVSFTLQSAAAGGARLPGLSISSVTGAATTAKFDLTLALSDGPDGLAGSLEYNTDLFDAATVDRMVEPLSTNLLDGIVADLPGRSSRFRSSPAPSACKRSASGTRPPHLGPRARRCTPSSRPRWTAPPTRSPWCSATRAAGQLQRARRGARTSSPIASRALGVGPESRSGYRGRALRRR